MRSAPRDTRAMRTSPVTILAVALALHAADAAAQADTPLPVSAFARVTLTLRATEARHWRRDARRWRGAIEQAAADSFRLRLRDGRAYTFAWDDLAQLDRHGGPVSRNEAARHGMLVGGAAGAVLLGSVGVIEVQTCVRGCDFVELAPLVGIVVGGTVGGVVGAVLGAARPGERWERVSLPMHPRVGLDVRHRRLGLAMRLR